MKFTNRFGIGLIGICALLLLGSPIYAATWTTIGGACTVDDGSVERVNLSSVFTHDPLRTGEIATRCNIVDVEDGSEWDTLVITYRDPDGPGTDYRVRANLISVNQSLGQIDIITVFDSNDQNIEGTGNRGQAFGHDFDFGDKAYYLYVTVFRADTANSAAFIRAEIRP